MVCFKAIMISKPRSYLASKRSRHQRSDDDCALSLSTPVASRNGHVGHTARPHGFGSRRTATGEPDPPSLRLTRMGSCRTKISQRCAPQPACPRGRGKAAPHGSVSALICSSLSSPRPFAFLLELLELLGLLSKVGRHAHLRQPVFACTGGPTSIEWPLSLGRHQCWRRLQSLERFSCDPVARGPDPGLLGQLYLSTRPCQRRVLVGRISTHPA